MNTSTTSNITKHPASDDNSTALTPALTTITIADAAGTPDYALQAVINSSAYGFASAAEAISTLYVIRNLQVRVAEMEAILESLNLVKSN